jgi:hypothetical protein
MKRIFFAAIIIIIAGCSKENKGQLDKNAMISIWPQGTQTKAENHLSNYEIVRQATNLSFYSSEWMGVGTRNFNKDQRDTINVRLLMYGTDIIDQNGLYVKEFVQGYDIVIRRNLTVLPATPVWDTIAYIPNNIISSAKIQIKDAYDRGDFAMVYELFNTAFTFVPCTSTEWRQLKAQGKN